jgi:hypothetical protein
VRKLMSIDLMVADVVFDVDYTDRQ